MEVGKIDIEIFTLYIPWSFPLDWCFKTETSDILRFSNIGFSQTDNLNS